MEALAFFALAVLAAFSFKVIVSGYNRHWVAADPVLRLYAGALLALVSAFAWAALTVSWWIVLLTFVVGLLILFGPGERRYRRLWNRTAPINWTVIVGAAALWIVRWPF